MNKGIAKIELIAEKIFLITWLILGFIFCFIYSIVLQPEYSETFALVCNFTKIITYLVYIFITVVIIKNLKNTTEILKNSTCKQQNEYNHVISFIFFIYIILTILWLTIGLCIVALLLTYAAINIDDGLSRKTALAFFELYIIVAGAYFCTAFTFINSIPALSNLASNVNPSLLNKFCLIGSGISILTILILTFVNLI